MWAPRPRPRCPTSPVPPPATGPAGRSSGCGPPASVRMRTPPRIRIPPHHPRFPPGAFLHHPGVRPGSGSSRASLFRFDQVHGIWTFPHTVSGRRAARVLLYRRFPVDPVSPPPRAGVGDLPRRPQAGILAGARSGREGGADPGAVVVDPAADALADHPVSALHRPPTCVAIFCALGGTAIPGWRRKGTRRSSGTPVSVS